jgi:O-antigen/teichoic acid export membrane protein
MIRVLDNQMYGKISLGKSIFHFFDISHVGIRYGLDRLLPEMKQEKIALEIFSVGFILNLISSFLLLLFWFFYQIDDVIFYCSFYVAGYLYAIVTLYRVFFRSFENKRIFIKITFISTFLTSISQLLGFLIWKINGYLICLTLSYLIAFFIIHYLYKIRITISYKKFIVITKKLFDKGWLLFISSLISYLGIFGDRFFIEEYGNLGQVADFSIVMFFFSIFNIFSVSYTEMIMNKIICDKSFRFVIKECGKLIILSVLILVLIYFILPFFINLIMPNYLRLIPYIKIILISAIPYTILPVLNYYLQAIDKRKQMLIINIISTFTYLILLLTVLMCNLDFLFIIYSKLTFIMLIVGLTIYLSIRYNKLISA